MRLLNILIKKNQKKNNLKVNALDVFNKYQNIKNKNIF